MLKIFFNFLTLPYLKHILFNGHPFQFSWAQVKGLNEWQSMAQSGAPFNPKNVGIEFDEWSNTSWWGKDPNMEIHTMPWLNLYINWFSSGCTTCYGNFWPLPFTFLCHDPCGWTPGFHFVRWDPVGVWMCWILVDVVLYLCIVLTLAWKENPSPFS